MSSTVVSFQIVHGLSSFSSSSFSFPEGLLLQWFLSLVDFVLALHKLYSKHYYS